MSHEAALRARLELRGREEKRLAHAVTAWADSAALEQARALDARAVQGETLPSLAGLVLSVKANVDVIGWTTSAGSRVLETEAVAQEDAPLVAALRANGAIILAQTNMVEFAYGALGQNSYFGTPNTPVYSHEARLTGGSSAGAGVTVGVGVVDAAIGTDTSGSVRIPAAFCGAAGFKPTQGRYSEKGIVPLALSLDTAGFVAGSIALCDQLDAAATDRAADVGPARSVRGLRFAVPRKFIEENSEASVLAAFELALDTLIAQGAVIEDRDMAYLADIGPAAREGNIVAAESYAWHQRLLQDRGELYDPRVGSRIAAGADVRAVDYIRARERLAELASKYHRDVSGFAAMLMPTSPVEPPLVSAIAEEKEYLRINMKVMQFTEFANRINVPSLTIPIGGSDKAIGLMANGCRREDIALLNAGMAIEISLGSTDQGEGTTK